MPHKLQHDEEKIKEILSRPMKLDFIPEYKRNLKQYAEHFLLQHIDREIERLDKGKLDVGGFAGFSLTGEPVKSQAVSDIAYGMERRGHNKAISDQITHLKSLKAELTNNK